MVADLGETDTFRSVIYCRLNINSVNPIFTTFASSISNTMSKLIKSGVATGDEVQAIFQLAKEKGFALPAVNVTSSSTVNGVMEAAAKLNAPAIIQFSNGGCLYFAGKALTNENEKAAILGGIAGAKHVHALAEAYGATVIRSEERRVGRVSSPV